MSAIALSWVASIKAGNQTAKQLLLFYASHNFGKPGFEFKNSTLANQLECSVSSIQRAHQLLVDKKLIIKESRYNSEGRQLTNSYYLNIPQDFIEKFMGEHEVKKDKDDTPVDNSGGEDSSVTPLGVAHRQGEDSSVTPLLNNNINNNINKSFRASPVQEKSKANAQRHEYPKQQTLLYKNEIKCTVQDWGPGHPTWDRLNT